MGKPNLEIVNIGRALVLCLLSLAACNGDSSNDESEPPDVPLVVYLRTEEGIEQQKTLDQDTIAILQRQIQELMELRDRLQFERHPLEDSSDSWEFIAVITKLISEKRRIAERLEDRKYVHGDIQAVSSGGTTILGGADGAGGSSFDCPGPGCPANFVDPGG